MVLDVATALLLLDDGVAIEVDGAAGDETVVEGILGTTTGGITTFVPPPASIRQFHLF